MASVKDIALAQKGLEGVPAVTTGISVIDGKKGKLRYRGIPIEDLAKNASFEEVVFLLWFGKLPTKLELKAFVNDLRSHRKLDKSVIPILKKGVKNMTSMDALRTITSYLAQFDPDLNHDDDDPKATVRKAIKLTAQYPTIVAHYWRLSQSKSVIQPKKDLAPGANFLYMLTGKMPNKLEAQAMELDFLLTAEHGMNASTFTTRVATSTLTDLHSALVAGLCTLKGPLHGAAREKVYDMLTEIKRPENVAPYVDAKIQSHGRIMGFGHRVYKTMDPRARIFRDVAHKLGKAHNEKTWYEVCDTMEHLMTEEFVKKRGKPLYPNVDFYTGAVYKYLGIPSTLSTGVFAIGRVAGWSAHFMEQRANNRLIRPGSVYTGPKNKKYVPISKR